MSKKKPLAVGCAILLLLGLLATRLLLDWKSIARHEVWRVYESGSEIIYQLEQYKNTNGYYPSSLDALVPEYLPHIPDPGWGLREWEYYPSEDKYGISVSADKNRYRKVIFTDGRWVINQ